MYQHRPRPSTQDLTYKCLGSVPVTYRYRLATYTHWKGFSICTGACFVLVAPNTCGQVQGRLVPSLLQSVSIPHV